MNYSLFDLIEDMLANAEAYHKPVATKPYAPPVAQQPKVSGYFCPKVQRVIFNGDATIVIFADGTKSTVMREKNDKYDKTTAVAYAIVKRLLATAYDKKSMAVNSNYINVIHGLVETGYDQTLEDENKAKLEREAQAKHEARQKIEQERAFRRRVKNRVKELKVEQAAQEMLKDNKSNFLVENAKPEGVVYANNPPSGMTRTSGLAQIDPKDAWKLYKKPDKPFSQFTQQEKRDYWKFHNAKRREKK